MRNNILKKIIVSIIIITGSVVEAYGISPVQYKLTATAIPTPTGEGSVYASTTSVSSVSETEWDNPKSVTISGYTWTAFSTEAYLYAKATATGYEFKGWGTSKTAVSPALTYDANNNNELTITFSGNRSSDATQTKEFYAIFGPEQYQISFSANGGTGTDPAQIPYTIESTGVTLPANPYTKTGYSFTGWQPTSNVGNWATSETYAAGATVPAGKYGTVTLQAKWDEMVDIVISVTGLQSGESAIFTVAKGSTTLYTVALNSTKSSLTINDQEPGEYTVTPLSWSWTYSMSSPITKTITSSDHTFEFTATKNTSSKKHAEKSNVNWHTP